MTTLRLLLITALALVAAPSVASASPTASGDFNGDGESDLAVGAPMDSVGGRDAAGAVNVIYGSSRGGLRAGGDQQFTQGTPGIQGWVEANDRFGSTLAAADFNADGYADLAIGTPGEDVSGTDNTGVVHVLYGSASGLTAEDELFGQGFAGVPGWRDAEQNFGAALAAGDFNGDGRADLAVGVPDDSVGDATAAGAVNVFYSASGGVRAGRDQIWTLESAGVNGASGDFFRFGSSLAAGDLNRDGRDDLAIGIPGARIGTGTGAGAVTVLYARADGLSARGDQLWSQGARGIKGGPEDNDSFGWSLAMGDFNQDGDADLAVGVPFESFGGVENAGAAQILYSAGRAGLQGADEIVHQGVRGIKGGPEAGDRFGLTLAAADFDGDGEADLAVGVPSEDLGDIADAGAVNVIYGSESSGLRSRDDFWSQGSPGIQGWVEAFDDFGRALGAGDFDGDGRWDLVAAAPRDSVAGYDDAGAVNVIYGARGGLSARGDQVWTQATRGIKGAVGDDQFGAAVASGTP